MSVSSRDTLKNVPPKVRIDFAKLLLERMPSKHTQIANPKSKLVFLFVFFNKRILKHTHWDKGQHVG